jgi:hypothetical protein
MSVDTKILLLKSLKEVYLAILMELIDTHLPFLLLKLTVDADGWEVGFIEDLV